MFSGKQEVFNKKPLVEARKAYKIEIGKLILEGKYSIVQASAVANVSYNTMQRFLQKAKLAYPELAKLYRVGK